MVAQKGFCFTYNIPTRIKPWSIKIAHKPVFPICSFFCFVFYLLLRETVRREAIDSSDPIKRVQFINKILEKDETQQPVDRSKFYNSLVTNHSKSQLTAVWPLDMAICMANNWMSICCVNGLQQAVCLGTIHNGTVKSLLKGILLSISVLYPSKIGNLLHQKIAVNPEKDKIDTVPFWSFSFE